MRKTGGAKSAREHGFSGNMIDRLGKTFYVRTNCEGCYNIIYNGQALALHKLVDEILGLRPRNLRLDFTRENAEQTERILSVFVDRFIMNKKNVEELSDYTTGHFKRGVE
jgi:putative protease